MSRQFASLREKAFDGSVVRGTHCMSPALQAAMGPGGSRTTERSNPARRETTEQFSPETRAAVQAARAAGRTLLQFFGQTQAVRKKGPKDLVTAADVAAEQRIRRMLHRRFPAIGFLGEEGRGVEGPGGRWIVDPLDGTIGFIAGLPFFGVSIALERRGQIDVGVILLPRLGELFVAEQGRGAWLNGRRIRVSEQSRLENAVVALWHDDTVWRNRRLRERIARLALRVRSLRIFGAAFSLACVAAGRLDGYWEQSAQPWDVAAGVLLVGEAGGRVTGGGSGPYDLNQSTILASNGRIHRLLVAALNNRPAGAGPRRV
jgi:myo-inositol-1(or 4)-monophosphatase